MLATLVVVGMSAFPADTAGTSTGASLAAAAAAVAGAGAREGRSEGTGARAEGVMAFSEPDEKEKGRVWDLTPLNVAQVKKYLYV